MAALTTGIEEMLYGGTGPSVCYTAPILPLIKSFCPYKTISVSAGGVTNIRACTSVETQPIVILQLA